jgi:hypothetical protein
LLLILTGISGCLAYLDHGILRDDTQHTTKFFEAQIDQSSGSRLFLSTIQTILESVRTYHLPAEFALKSIDATMMGEIDQQYTELIDTIDQILLALGPEVAVGGSVVVGSGADVVNEGDLVANLFREVIQWALKYPVTAMQHDYVYQKLFLVMFHVSICLYEIGQTTTVLHNYDKRGKGPTLHKQSVFLAATFMSELGVGRLCVCEGIMLSVFLKRPYPQPDPYGQWEMADIKERLEFQSMWDDFGLDPATRSRIITYTEATVIPVWMVAHDSVESHLENTVDPTLLNLHELHLDNAVDPNKVPLLSLDQSHVMYVYWNFVTEIQRLQNLLEDKIRMEPKHRQQLLKWTKRVWDRLCKPMTEEEATFKSDTSKVIQASIEEIETKINSGSSSDAGPS